MDVINQVHYALATHGVRRLTVTHPAVRQQFRNLDSWVANKGGEFRILRIYDYARSVRGLYHLPSLSMALEADVAVRLDDLGRLFRPCPDLETANSLLRELEPYANQLTGLRQGKALSQLSTRQIGLFLSGEQNPRYIYGKQRVRSRSQSQSRRSAKKANAASSRSRADAAKKKAQSLVEVRERLVAEGVAPSFKKIADRANADGLRTTRGNEWRADTVFRALNRLTDE